MVDKIHTSLTPGTGLEKTRERNPINIFLPWPMGYLRNEEHCQKNSKMVGIPPIQ